MVKVSDKPTPQNRKSEKSAKPPKATAKPAASKASHLSQEFVVDSEDEDAAPEDRNVKKVVNPIQVNGAGASATAGKSSTESSEEDEEEDNAESEDDHEVLPPRPPNKVPAKTNGVKRSASESSGESEEKSELGEETEQSAAKRQKVDSDGTTESSSEGDEEDQEEDGSDVEDAPVAKKNAPKPSKEAARTMEEQATVSEPIAAKAFQPPAGYLPLDTANVEAMQGFTAASLAGKQIWHITAPSDVPLSSVKEVALDAIQSGRPLLTHNGADYVLNEDSTDNDQTAVFLPDKGGFKPSESRVDKTLHLQQKISLPNLSARQASQLTGSAAAGDVAQAPIRTVRPQPKGLRMRYRPPGYGTGKPGNIGSGSDSADEDGPRERSAAFQFPRTLGAHGTSEQEANGGATAQEPNGPAKKPKKKRKEKQKDLIADSPVANGSSAVTNAAAEVAHVGCTTASAAVTPAKKVVAPESGGDGDVTMADAATPATLSKEEKARRKEERRLRKEAKLKAKTA